MSEPIGVHFTRSALEHGVRRRRRFRRQRNVVGRDNGLQNLRLAHLPTEGAPPRFVWQHMPKDSWAVPLKLFIRVVIILKEALEKVHTASQRRC